MVEKTVEEMKNDKELLIKNLSQQEKDLDFSKRDKEIMVKIFEFEKNHCKLVEDKLEYVLMQEYWDLVMEKRKLQYDLQLRQLNDNISRFELGIDGTKSQIEDLDGKIGDEE